MNKPVYEIRKGKAFECNWVLVSICKTNFGGDAVNFVATDDNREALEAIKRKLESL